MRLDRRNVPKEVNPRIGTSPLPAGIIELNKVRRDLLTVFGIWIHVLSDLEQREVFGTKFFCNSFIFWDSHSAISRSTSIEPPAGVSLTRLFGTEFLLNPHVVA